ncbi:MAG: copper resistance protein CopC [Microthrixaceae bacterium]
MAPAIRRQAARTAAFVAAVLVTAWFLVAPAGAHAVLEATDPPAGSVLAESPPHVTLTFDEVVSLPPDAVRLLDVEGGRIRIGRAVSADEQVRAEIPVKLRRGSYVVAWRIISADSHPLSGAFTFSVGAPSRAGSGASAETVAKGVRGESVGSSIAVDAVAVLMYAGLLVCVGAVWFSRYLVVDGGAAVDRIRVLVGWSGIAGLVGFVLALPAEAALAAGSFRAVVSGGALWDELSGEVGLQALLGIVGLSLVLSGARRRTVGGDRLVWIGSILALSAPVAVGHTRSFGPTALIMVGDLAHLGAGAIWTGGLAALLIVLRTPPEEGTVRHRRDARIIAGFSRWATVSIVAVAAAGVLVGWRILGGPGRLFSTAYGITLLVKVGLFGGVAGLGAYNHFVLVRRAERDDGDASAAALRRTVLAEVAIIAAILIVTGVLTSLSPRTAAAVTGNGGGGTEVTAATDDPSGMDMSGMAGMDHGGNVTTTSRRVTVARRFGTGQVAVTVTPAASGPNSVIVIFANAKGAPQALKEAPTVRFRLRARDIGPIVAAAVPLGASAYRVEQDLVIPGRWEINVSAVVSDFEQPQATMTVPIDP